MRELAEIERSRPQGLTSRQIVDLFETRGIRFSEATLRKYVQLGLLPRSVRVGRKGKHRGSCGLYPAQRRAPGERGEGDDGRGSHHRGDPALVRRASRTRSTRSRRACASLIASFEREAKGPTLDAERRRELEREITEAKRAAGELVRRISGLERRLSAQAEPSAARALPPGAAATCTERGTRRRNDGRRSPSWMTTGSETIYRTSGGRGDGGRGRRRSPRWRSIRRKVHSSERRAGALEDDRAQAAHARRAPAVAAAGVPRRRGAAADPGGVHGDAAAVPVRVAARTTSTWTSTPRAGRSSSTFPHLEVWEMAETCSLDVADRAASRSRRSARS